MRIKSYLALILYRVLIAAALVPGALFLAYSRRRDEPYGKDFKQLLGMGLPRFPDGSVIFHAASMGEANALRPLVSSFIASHPDIHTVMTSLTTTGHAAAAKVAGATVCYSPLDCLISQISFNSALKPRMLVIADTELWPEKLISARRAGCPVVLVNARMQEKNLEKYLDHADLVEDLIARQITLALCATPQDAERYRRLGVDPSCIRVTGNLKYDLTPDSARFEFSRKIKAEIDGSVLGAISTHRGEEGIILDTFLKMRHTMPNLSLVLVPRHQDGVIAAAEILRAQGIEFVKKSELAALSDFKGGILIGDTMGEIALYFGLIDLAFMGGSFTDTGGHNPLEPACYGIPTVTGPDFHNFQSEYENLIAAEASSCVTNQAELISTLGTLLASPELMQSRGQHALEVLQTGQGAVGRTIEELDRILNEAAAQDPSQEKTADSSLDDTAGDPGDGAAKDTEPD